MLYEKVPWAGMSWSEIQNSGFKALLEKHLVKLTALKGAEKTAEYLRYLKSGV